MQIGSTYIKAGWIHALLVLPQYWGREYPDILIQEAFKILDENEYDIAVGYGIKGYYERWSVAPVMPGYDIILQVKDIPECEENIFLPIKDEEIPQMLQWYEFSNKNRTGIVKRSPERWQWILNKPEDILIGENGYIGYALDDKTLDLREIGAEDNLFYDTAIRKLSHIAKENGKETIIATLPPDHPFTYASSYYGAKVYIDYRKMHGCLATAINIQSLFEKLCPELEKRLALSVFKDMKIYLSIISEKNKANIILNSNSQTQADLLIQLPSYALAQLLLGYKPAEQILFEQNVKLESASTEIISILFPYGYSFVWLADRI